MNKDATESHKLIDVVSTPQPEPEEEIGRPVGYYDVRLSNGDVIQILDVIDALQLNFALGCVMKYVARAGRKPGTRISDDLKKALDYLSGEYFREKDREKGYVNGLVPADKAKKAD